MSQYDEPVDTLGFGHLFTVEEFRADVADGYLIDYDGYGSPVKDGMRDDKTNIYPSNLGAIPADATHILWFNR